MTDDGSNLPGLIKSRAFDYTANMGVNESEAKAAACRDFDKTNKETANLLGVNERTASSYYSKFGQTKTKALSLVVSTIGGPKDILAWDELKLGDGHYDEYIFIAKPLIEPDEDHANAHEYPPEGELVVITVRGGNRGGHPSGSLDINTESYDDIEELVDDRYRNREFDDLRNAKQWRALLVEAGYAEGSLAAPDKRLPATHPDSHYHVQRASE